MDQHPQYAGSPLDLDDSFRLIRLEPGQRDEPIQIHLVNSCLSLNQHYEALSYTWGNPTTVSQINVVNNGSKFATTMSITANCHSALRRLRCPDRPRTLWVDAICINQSLIQERNHQLGLMTRIYQGASRVLVYLGESDGDSDMVMEWIRELHTPSDFGRGITTSWPSRRAVHRFFSRPWFRRVWVLQEVKFARLTTVICGNQEADWESFSTFQHWTVLRAEYKLPYSVVYTSKKADRQSLTAWLASLSYAQHLAQVLQGARLCEATDPRDKVFAVVPLADSDYKEAKRAGLAQATSNDKNDEIHNFPASRTIDVGANYGHSACRVFTKLALSLLRELGLDDLLSMVHTDARRGIPGLPSWVPDWSVQSLPVKWGMEYSEVHAGFQTREEAQVGSVKPTWRVRDLKGTETTPTEQALHVPAVCVGTITKAGAVCCVDKDFLPIGQWKQLAPQDRNDELSEYTGSPFVSVLFGGRNSLRFEMVVNYIREYNGEVLTDKERKTISRLCWRKEWGDRRSGLKHKMEDEFTFRVVDDDNSSRLERMPLRPIFADKKTFGTLGNHLLDRCDGKRFVVLDTGLMGLTVGSADIGDQVWILENVTRPFVFRKTGMPDVTSKSNTSAFIGPSWIYGAMFGEIWRDVVKEQGEGKTLGELIIV
ncbi:heterokaryon incompatibility protein-domain-containing protein [Immersiella caudata]|uniref:Heterokaryon incompatibility protein-domain-containing protein n=1 Tax=Immersiella caudata TaxID=314043 RepID=A0AA39WDU5_9PEZI|nr:heterokaryon incompatibility protein-domain-containing protein [Immersiella caudata]